MSGGLTRDEVERLYTQFAPVVFRRARRLLARDADAWDVVQEVFERMLSHGSTFRREARPMTWVYRVTTNLALNHLRGRALREPRLTVVDEAPGAGLDDVEARQLLSRWAAGLGERELEVASLLYLDGLTQQEVADVLELSRKTIVREVEALRAKLEALGALPRGGT
jgi:RNA polymerase sigma-70 factor (ECF subfamily)